MAPVGVMPDHAHRREPNLNSTPDGFYSSTTYTDKLLSYLSDRTGDEPFFAYLPFSAPHCPLQCYREDRDLYKGVYDEGPEALRKKRLEALAEMEMIAPNVVPHDVMANTPLWSDLTPNEKRMSSRSYECYAGMITCMDREIGRVLDHLKSTDELDNTVVMFFSDNGAEGGEYGESI